MNKFIKINKKMNQKISECFLNEEDNNINISVDNKVVKENNTSTIKNI